MGWNTREEVDLVGTPGHSYGWPCYEGAMHTTTYQDDPKCDPEYAKEGTAAAHVPPDYDYLHTATNAIIGGPIYPGGSYPDSFDGQMFFGDYSAGFLKVLNPTGRRSRTTPFATNRGGVDLILAPDGNVAFPDFGTGEPGTGSIRRPCTPSAGAPHASPRHPVAGGSPRTWPRAPPADRPEGQALTYSWDSATARTAPASPEPHLHERRFHHAA